MNDNFNIPHMDLELCSKLPYIPFKILSQYPFSTAVFQPCTLLCELTCVPPKTFFNLFTKTRIWFSQYP